MEEGTLKVSSFLLYMVLLENMLLLFCCKYILLYFCNDKSCFEYNLYELPSGRNKTI